MSATQLPLKKGRKADFPGCVGAWIGDGHGDVHAYTQSGNGTVVGMNKDYNDKIQFSDIALFVNEKNECILQYADAKGECVQVPAPEALVRAHVVTFLEGLRNAVVFAK